MGYYQDHFPGSPAQRQRIFVSRVLIGLSAVIGASVFFFTPKFRRIRKELADGNVIAESDFFAYYRQNLKDRGWISPNPTSKDFIKATKKRDKMRTRDADADISEESIRARYN